MADATYSEMTTEHLGDNATENDLAAFQRACFIRNHTKDETEEETTDWMWGNGDWLPRVLALVDYDPESTEDMSNEIRMGDCDR
jgi:hypothetical protein